MQPRGDQARAQGIPVRVAVFLLVVAVMMPSRIGEEMALTVEQAALFRMNARENALLAEVRGP